MPPAFIQSKGGTSNTLSSLPVSFTSNNAAGNLLVCSGVVNASGIAGLTITDTQGNTWTIALVDNWKPLSTFFMAYAPNCKAGANTVTIAQLGSLISGAVSEYSGVSTTTPLDEVGFSDSGAGTWTSATSGNVTTRENGELIVAAQGNATGPASVTLGSGFSNLQNDSGNFVSIESRVQATAGAIAGTFTISASSGACGVLTFVPAGETAFNVWVPQGNIVANPGGNKIGNPSVIPGLTGIVLGGTVFGMWAGNDLTGAIYYFESADGLTSWTADVSNPIGPAGNAYFPTVYEVAGTFYLYGCTSSFPGTGIAVYTATSQAGPWTAHGVQIPLGAGGAWDSVGTFQLNIVDIIAGTWYAYYSGENGVKFGQGLVTSTDGIHWTKSPSNPIFPGPIGNMTFLKVSGSAYYAYAPFTSPNAALAAINNNPIGRWFSTSPSGPWAQLTYSGTPVPVYYVSTASELNNSGGLPGANANDPRMVVANGNIYLYYTLTFTGGVEQSVNAALASGYTPAQLTATYEGVFNVPFTGLTSLNLTTLATDNFSRANANPIGGNWTAVAAGGGFGGSQILSDVVEPATLANPNGTSYYNAITWPNDQWATITAVALANNSATIGGGVRENISGTSNLYQARWAPSSGHALGQSGIWSIVKRNAGSGTTLATGTGMVVSATDTITSVVIGTNIYLYWNGYLVAVATDSALTSGAAGFVNSVTTALSNSQLNGWSGGGFQDAPFPSASISGNAGVGAATVAYSGTSSGSVTADSFGNYLLSNLPDGSYTITPSLSGYTFSPTSSNQILSGTNITGVNFVATQQSSTTAGPSSGLQSVQLYGRLANGSIIAVSIDINGNLAVSGGTGGAINSVDVLKNGVATPAMVYGVTSAGKLVAVAVDANGNLCCANVGAGGGNSSTTVDIAKYATPTPVQAVGREPISGKLYAVPLNASNSLYDSVHPGATPTSSLTVPGVAPRPVQLCGRAPNGKIIAVALDTSGRLCVSGSGQSGSANAVDAFKNGVPLAIQLFGINSAGKLQPVPLDANGNLELS